MFAPLPAGFPAIEATVSRLDAVDMVPPPEWIDIGQRLRLVYDEARKDGYVGLGSRHWRQLPYSYWVDGQAALPESHPELVSRYWGAELPTVVADDPRRARRWLSALFHTYCGAFRSNDADFAAFAERLSTALNSANGNLATRLKTMRDEVRFFDPHQAPARLAAELLLATSGTLDERMAKLMLSSTFPDTGLGSATLEAALSTSRESRRSEWFVRRTLEWLRRLPTTPDKSPMRTAIASGLLLPFSRSGVEASPKDLLLDFFLRYYGDPRIAGKLAYQWSGVDQSAIDLVLGWLAGDTLRDFMIILRATADSIWEYREKFWMAYYNAGHIEEAWLLLGPLAQMVAKSKRKELKGRDFGRLESPAQRDQSVLLLRIGDIIFTEWSHNGSLRAHKRDSEHAPRLYRASYRGSDLKDSSSMDFNHGTTKYPQLFHSNSDSLSWQTKARAFIEAHTGASVPTQAFR